MTTWNEIIFLYVENNNQEAKILLENFFVNEIFVNLKYQIKKYDEILIEHKDIFGYCYEWFWEAVKKYRYTETIKFNSYIYIILKSKIRTMLRKYWSKSNKFISYKNSYFEDFYLEKQNSVIVKDNYFFNSIETEKFYLKEISKLENELIIEAKNMFLKFVENAIKTKNKQIYYQIVDLFFKGYKKSEISKTLNINYSTCNSFLTRCLKKMFSSKQNSIFKKYKHLNEIKNYFETKTI